MSTSISQPKPTTKVISLVLDSGPLIKNTPIHHLAQKFYTIPEVLNEIRDKKSREYVGQLPFELEIKNPSEHALREGKFKINLSYPDRRVGQHKSN